MAVILSDENLSKFKTNKDNLRAEVKKLNSNLGTALTRIKGGNDGALFRNNTAKGRTYYNNLKSIIEILQDLYTDLNKLNDACDSYYTKASKANKK